MTELVQKPSTAEIPDKLYFKIGEVSELLAVKAHVLRFWESEFPQLAPKKSGTGHRLYRRKDVELLLRIKQLLYDQRFTIEGAKQALHMESRSAKPRKKSAQQKLFTGDPLLDIRRELGEILTILK